MDMRSTFVIGSFAATLAAALVVGCGGPGSGGPKGTVVIDGSSTVFRISKAAQIGYAREGGGDVQVLVSNSGTGGGFGKYLQGEIDIVDASRPAKPEEEAQAREKGLEWARFVVGYDGITVVVNPENTFCKSLTVAQLKEMFKPDSTIQNWKQVDPSYPDLKIVFYTPDNDSGTFDFFTEAITGTDGAQRNDVQASSDDNVLVTGVAGDKGAIGYFGFAYYAANRKRLKEVAVQNGPDAEPIAPTHETILAGRYEPLSRPLYLYVKNSAMKRPDVRDFLEYYITNIDTLAAQADYVPPMPEAQTENLAKLKGEGKASTDRVAATEDDAPAETAD